MDTLTLISCSARQEVVVLKLIHEQISYLVITRLFQYLKKKNISQSIKCIKKVCQDCLQCAELKSKYYQKRISIRIHPTKSFEKMNTTLKDHLHQIQKTSTSSLQWMNIQSSPLHSSVRIWVLILSSPYLFKYWWYVNTGVSSILTEGLNFSRKNFSNI